MTGSEKESDASEDYTGFLAVNQEWNEENL